MNPYWGKNFFTFFAVFFSRLKVIFSGGELATDEVQLIVLTLVALSCAFIGTFLKLKKMAMLANSLSHTILLGIVLAYLLMLPFTSKPGADLLSLSLPTLFIAAIATGLITALFTEFLTKSLGLQEDASIGLVFTTLFALGIVIVTLFAKNVHIGTEVIMGNVDALHRDDIKLVGAVLLLNLIVILPFIRQFTLSAFDAPFARSVGISNSLCNYVLMTLTASTAIAAFRAVGVILVLSLLIGPPLIARLFTKQIKTLLLLSSAIGIGVAFIGVATARHILTVYHLPLSTGGVVTTYLGIIYFISLISKNRNIAIKSR